MWVEFWQKFITQIAEIAPVYLVGGTVRDSLLQKPSKDVDGIVALPLEILEKHIKKWGYHPLRIGAKHQTLTVFHQGERIDFNPFSGSLEEDALRRDFTINAIYQNGKTGEIIDPLGGREDLEKKILRACGDPYERFREDPLRILRMVRFSCKYNLTIEENTLSAAKEFLPKISSVALERISEELGTILILENPRSALTLLMEIGYLDMYLPELANLQNCMARPGYNEDLWEHTLKVVENTPPEYLLRLAGLFHHL
ncbi:MAG: CCA tRNA nucleotidyltransferase, partial [Desulfitobacterium sp.]|nr:CCA tRNA nucleotidyltransferase [Desulfitobacterium sp.]